MQLFWVEGAGGGVKEKVILGRLKIILRAQNMPLGSTCKLYTRSIHITYIIIYNILFSHNYYTKYILLHSYIIYYYLL